MSTKQSQVGNGLLTAKLDAARKLAFEKELKSVDIRLFLYVCTYAWGKGGVCKKTMSEMAKDFSLSRITIQRSLKKLQKKGYIQHVYRVKKHNEVIVELTDWNKVKRLNGDGCTILRTFFKINNRGFFTYGKPSKNTMS